jgi:hypothetical protein
MITLSGFNGTKSLTRGPVEEDVAEAASDDVELVADDGDSGVKFWPRQLSFDTPDVPCGQFYQHLRSAFTLISLKQTKKYKCKLKIQNKIACVTFVLKKLHKKCW